MTTGFYESYKRLVWEYRGEPPHVELWSGTVCLAECDFIRQGRVQFRLNLAGNAAPQRAINEVDAWAKGFAQLAIAQADYDRQHAKLPLTTIFAEMVN